MAPDRIRLIDLKTQTVDWHQVDTLSWDKVWTISHIWDRGNISTRIPLGGVSWVSNSFSSDRRFNLMFEKTREIVEEHGAEYVWIDAACIHQGTDEEEELERKEQIPLMGTIYGMSAGCVAFGKQTSEDRFVEIASTYDDGRKAWVCSWFERVWTFQELQLPNVLLFVSGDHVLRRDEVYLSILMASPYLSSPRQSPPSLPNDTHILTQDVVNALSPLSKSNTQRSLMQTSKRGCSADYINDKVYGILGVLPKPLAKLHVDYTGKISLAQAVLNLMKLMPSKDILDTLTFNTLPPADDIHDAVHWSGMVRLDGPTEHPSYEKDVYNPAMNARVDVAGEPPRATTRIPNAPLWKVVVTKPEHTHADLAETHIRAWPSIASLSKFSKLTDDFSKVERSADYAHAIGRAERSLAANWTLLKPLLDKAASSGVGGEALSSILQNPPTNTEARCIPPNRLGDARLFDQEVTVLVCRSKADKSFHYGIVVTPNEDNTWHKVCTAAFSDSCVVSTSTEHLVAIGR
ncbi:hypothetical protein OG21DRAFT_1513387 [Imleria badia]|nr:hypothetical protein OG21DRAFT_1513387 [Imleria badia]